MHGFEITTQKMKFPLRISLAHMKKFTRNCLHLLKRYLIENFSFLCSKICIMFKDSEIKKAK